MDEKPSLEYEQRGSFVSQRQYRWLMTLTLLNTILLLGFVCGPYTANLIKTQWSEFQAQRARARDKAARAALVAACRSYLAPADQVVYEERPNEAAKLMASGGYAAIRDAMAPHFPMQDWQSPVWLKTQALGLNSPLLFAHGLKDPSGDEKLVMISLQAQQRFLSPASDDTQRYYSVQMRCELYAVAEDLDEAKSRETKLDVGRLRMFYVRWTHAGTDWDHGKLEYDTDGLFRFYAGQLDPGDPSHFTIDYEAGGKRGTIDGWLRKDRYIELRPRDGEVEELDSRGEQLLWNMRAPATTRRGEGRSSTRPLR